MSSTLRSAPAPSRGLAPSRWEVGSGCLLEFALGGMDLLHGPLGWHGNFLLFAGVRIPVFCCWVSFSPATYKKTASSPSADARATGSLPSSIFGACRSSICASVSLCKGLAPSLEPPAFEVQAQDRLRQPRSLLPGLAPHRVILFTLRFPTANTQETWCGHWELRWSEIPQDRGVTTNVLCNNTVFALGSSMDRRLAGFFEGECDGDVRGRSHFEFGIRFA